jgi:CBS domain-containing protein
MHQTIAEVMTPDPFTVMTTATLAEVAQIMRDADIGDVVVMSNGIVGGLITDRDIVVRAVAGGEDPVTTTVGQVASADVICAAPSDSIGDAVALMRQRAVRRLPVVDDGRLVGLVSLGDLAMELDESSALSEISAAPPNG